LPITTSGSPFSGYFLDSPSSFSTFQVELWVSLSQYQISFPFSFVRASYLIKMDCSEDAIYYSNVKKRKEKKIKLTYYKVAGVYPEKEVISV
jgi:hypothetical protein